MRFKDTFRHNWIDQGFLEFTVYRINQIGAVNMKTSPIVLFIGAFLQIAVINLEIIRRMLITNHMKPLYYPKPTRNTLWQYMY